MDPKYVRLITIGLGLGMAGLTAWKGPTVAGACAASITGLVVLFGVLGVIPAKDQAYIDQLEKTLEQAAPKMAAQVVRK